MQVADHVRQKIRSRLAEACSSSSSSMEDEFDSPLSCDVSELEAICRDVLEEEMTRTNLILGRRKRRGE